MVAPAQDPSTRRVGIHRALGLFAPLVVTLVCLWTLHPLTVDDAYISYRYAENLAAGAGVVYNPGEFVEGYTNFLWVALLAGGAWLGLDVDTLADLLGGAGACAAVVAAYALSVRVRVREDSLPIYVAPWLVASSVSITGYAVSGMETALFVGLCACGIAATLREREDGRAPWVSGALLALATLTRPEGVLFAGVALLAAGRDMLGRRNLARAAIAAGPVLAHALWRRAYYGAWLPNTFHAKTGDLGGQVERGLHYLWLYTQSQWWIVPLAAIGVALVVRSRSRAGIVCAAAVFVAGAYIVAIGGDWMPAYRHITMLEVYLCVLADVAALELYTRLRARGPRVAALALALGCGFVLWQRASRLAQMRDYTAAVAIQWDWIGGQPARWLLQHGTPGLVAAGDIGYLGYATGWPILDLIGLVDPAIATLPGGYNQKHGAEYQRYIRSRRPAYFLSFVRPGDPCDKPYLGAHRAIQDARDGWFASSYTLEATFVDDDGTGCMFRHREHPPARP